MHEHGDHNQGGYEPHVDPAHQGEGTPGAFPGTEPIEGHADAMRPLAEPAPRKPSWAERRAARKSAAGGESTESTSTPKPNPLAMLPWDLRAKIAVVLSFVILVTVLILNRDRLKGKDAKKTPVVAISSGKAPEPETPELPTPDPKTVAADEAKAKEIRLAEENSKAAAEKAAATLAQGESPPRLPVEPEKDKVVAAPIEMPPDLSAIAKAEAKDKELPPIGDVPPDLGAETKPADTPVAEVVKPVEVPAVEVAKPVEAPTTAVNVELKPVEAPVATMPPLSPTPATAEAPKQIIAAAPVLITPQIAPGGGFPIPKGRPKSATEIDSSKITSVPLETMLIDAPKRAQPAENVLSTASPAAIDGKGGEVYVVRRGDNFWSISKYHYGSSRYYKALWDANRDVSKTIDDLYIGTPIRIPQVEDLNRNLIEVPKTARAVGRPSAEINGQGSERDTKALRTSAKAEGTLPVLADSENPTPKPKAKKSVAIPQSKGPRYREYVVRGANETLRSIARKELGDTDREDELYEANESRLDADSSKLKVGMTIRIPDESRRQ